MTTVKIRIFCPVDPLGTVPGGIDTFIRGILKWAPEDLQFSLVGMTTNTLSRPLGKWTRCNLGRREFELFPVVYVSQPGTRSKIPLSLRYTIAVALRHRNLQRDFDVFEFHRVEPEIVFRGDPRPKNAFFHQNMSIIRDANTDILWKYAPAVYEAIERSAMSRLSSIWCVRGDAVEEMRLRYHDKRNAIRFIPTWVDTEVFYPVSADVRTKNRQDIAASFKLDTNVPWVVSVGRLDRQKNPKLLISSVAKILKERQKVELLIIGDGVLRPNIEHEITTAGLREHIHLLGLRDATEIARILSASDVFALSSAYEGMPMAVLEALGSGLPVASTDVGEVQRVVRPGFNGSLAQEHNVEAFTACLKAVLVNRHRYSGSPATTAIQEYRPNGVLAPVYENYRELATRGTASRGNKQSDCQS